MFEDLNWKSAARRSAVVIAIYLGLFYVLSKAFPKSFGLVERGQVISLLINAVLFFFVFTVIYALVERSRNRRMAESRKQGSGRPRGNEDDPGAGASSLKGRPNPNTSRKKSRRRR